MKDLMCDIPFAKISIGDICDRCGMNRKSFYYHFKDKYDLVNWIFQTEFMEQMRFYDFSSEWDFFTGLCGYLYRERSFYSNALNYEGQNSFREYFSETISSILSLVVSDHFKTMEDSRFYVTFFTDAFVASIVRWLMESPVTPPNEYVEKLRMCWQL